MFARSGIKCSVLQMKEKRRAMPRSLKKRENKIRFF